MTTWQTTRGFFTSANSEFVIVLAITHATEFFVFMKEIDGDDGQFPYEFHSPQFGLKWVQTVGLHGRTDIFVYERSFDLWYRGLESIENLCWHGLLLCCLVAEMMS